MLEREELLCVPGLSSCVVSFCLIRQECAGCRSCRETLAGSSTGGVVGGDSAAARHGGDVTSCVKGWCGEVDPTS